jgi:hypothetical protein
MKSSLYWNVIQHGLVVICRRFGTAYRPIFNSQTIFLQLDCCSLEDGTGRLSRKASQHCVMLQKSEDLIIPTKPVI